MRERRILLETTLAGDPANFARIFVHELFHFAWLRLGNPRRRSYELLLAEEIAARAAGELGWSAEWRKYALAPSDRRLRTRRWREYACESFCDSAAWLYSGRAAIRNLRCLRASGRAGARWFARSVATDGISV